MDAAVARLLDEVDRFCAGPTPASGPGRAARVIHSRRAIDHLETRFSRDAAAFATTDEYEAQGAVSPIDWIRLNCNMGGGAAADRVAVGSEIERMPETIGAIETGDIGFAHVALIARTATAVAASGTNVPFDESPLLTKALEFSVGRFRNFCEHARHAGDPDGYVAEEVECVAARSLVFTTGEGGMVWLRGVLDSEGGAAVRTALEPLAKKTGRDDDRMRDRRLADALVEAMNRLLDAGGLPSRGTVRPHIQVTTTLDTLLARVGAPAAELEFSPLPISAKAVERLACDCNVTRVLLGSDSMVIDVGRSRRVISAPQKRALDVRDKGCRWPGCDRSATWTRGHHLVHWARGGTTDLPNLVLLCFRHHWLVHEGGWQLVKSEDGQLLTVPPMFSFNRNLARGPD